MKWEEAIERFSIQKIYHNCSFGDGLLIPEKYRKFGQEWLASKNKKSLFISGNPGSGKTYFAYVLFREIVEAKFPWVIFINSIDLEDKLLESAEKLIMFKEVPILFLDDLGVEKVNERVIKQYYSLIDYRSGNELLSVFTSNLPLDRIHENLGDRIASRLKMAKELKFPNKDLRKEL